MNFLERNSDLIHKDFLERPKTLEELLIGGSALSMKRSIFINPRKIYDIV